MSKLKAQATPLEKPLPGGGSPGAAVTVEPLLGGSILAPQGFFESKGGRLANLRMLGIGTPKSKWWLVPIPAYLITHPTAGPILVDTAFHGSVAAKPSANLGQDRRALREAQDRAGPRPARPAPRARHRRPRPEDGHPHPPPLRSQLRDRRVPEGEVRPLQGRSGRPRRPTRGRSCAATAPPTTTTSSTTTPSTSTDRASPPTRASAAPSTCSATAASASPSRPATPPDTAR